MITLTLSIEQLNVLLSGLGHIPYMHAQPLLLEIQRKAKYRLNDAKADGGTSSQCDLRLKNSKTLRHTLRHGSLA
jgi:hypothetical protein